MNFSLLDHVYDSTLNDHSIFRLNCVILDSQGLLEKNLSEDQWLELQHILPLKLYEIKVTTDPLICGPLE